MADASKRFLTPAAGTRLRQRGRSVHREVAQVAIDIVSEAYDQAMHNSTVWERWRKMHPGASRLGLYRIFVQAYLPGCIEEARRRMAMQLGDEALPVAIRDHIAEVLVEDAGLFQGRVPLGGLVDEAKEVANGPEQAGLVEGPASIN